MSLPCLPAARSFDAARHLPFVIGRVQVGWIRREDAALLARWPAVFELGQHAVVLTDRLATEATRSDALGEVIEALAAEQHIVGWRDETYAIRNAFEDLPLALIERAASRFFGIMTFGVNLNGVVTAQAAHTAQLNMWIARRSLQKPTDPGMLDTLVGGGIGWGYSVPQALVKEAWEESGIPAELAEQARFGGVLHVLREIPEGTHAEQLYVYDLELPADFMPQNQDGEVSEHCLAPLEQVLDHLRTGSMTVDASLSALDCLRRAGKLDAATQAQMAGLYRAPELAPG
jgi:8-oxo-dGTP pyrophosphatase MutT (NUDIX family)